MDTKSAIKFFSLLSEPITLGTFINAIRLNDEISQIDFANRLGISQQQLCDIEHNRKSVSPQTAAKYAEILGFPIPQFIRLVLQSMVDKYGLDIMIDVKPRPSRKLSQKLKVLH